MTDTKVRKPVGNRCIVEDIVTTLSLEERGRRVNIAVVTQAENRPTSTSGLVLAVGSDPLIQSEVQKGDIVHFSRLSGQRITIEDHEYRMLEFEEILYVERDLPAGKPN